VAQDGRQDVRIGRSGEAARSRIDPQRVQAAERGIERSVNASAMGTRLRARQSSWVEHDDVPVRIGETELG